MAFTVSPIHSQRTTTTTTTTAATTTTATILLAKPTTAVSLGDYIVELEKPLGMLLEENDSTGSGVFVKEILEDGSAQSSRIAPGDVLLRVNDEDVSSFDFDAVMDTFVSAPSPIQLTLGDGLGKMDMAQNLIKTFSADEKSQRQLFFVDKVVREAVRYIRRDGRLGAVREVEIIVGAGVSKDGKECKVRFFAIFSTDGVSSYSCNVAATGRRRGVATDSTTVNGDNESADIELTYLSCAKDEGLGQTVDLIV